MSILVGLISLIAFFTIIPLPKDKVNLEEAGKNMYLSPIIGIFIGFISGLLTYFFKLILPNLIAGFLGLATLLIITGSHHVDGLIDFGDALMVRESKEKRLEVMRDVKIGVGGVVLGFFVLILTGLSLTSIKVGLIIQALIISELCAKNSLVILACFAKPAKDGIGKLFIERVHKRRTLSLLATLIISTLVAYLLFNLIGFLAVLVSIICSIAMLFVAKSQFEVVTGDVFGALNEISRLIVIITIIGA
jgi:adenosylcobinamide-GDP ribazoletransferase